jgi:hypothetical protein
MKVKNRKTITMIQNCTSSINWEFPINVSFEADEMIVRHVTYESLYTDNPDIRFITSNCVPSQCADKSIIATFHDSWKMSENTRFDNTGALVGASVLNGTSSTSTPQSVFSVDKSKLGSTANFSIMVYSTANNSLSQTTTATTGGVLTMILEFIEYHK